VNKHVEPHSVEPRPPCLSCVTHDVLQQELTRSVPQYSGDKGPTIMLESRYGDPYELQCLASLVSALGVPLRHAIEQMWCDSQCGHMVPTLDVRRSGSARSPAGRRDRGGG
jgi:hypothetical protein